MAGARAAVLCLLAVAAISSPVLQAQPAAPTVDRCTKDYNKIMLHCKKHMEKTLGDKFPQYGSQCCVRVRKTQNISCICNKFTDDDKEKISLAKWAAVTKVCGNRIPAGTNCAGYTVPDRAH